MIKPKGVLDTVGKVKQRGSFKTGRYKSELSGKVIKNIHNGKKHIIDHVQPHGNGNYTIWLKKGTCLTKKAAIQNYQLYWNGYKNLSSFLR